MTNSCYWFFFLSEWILHCHNTFCVKGRTVHPPSQPCPRPNTTASTPMRFRHAIDYIIILYFTNETKPTSQPRLHPLYNRAPVHVNTCGRRCQWIWTQGCPVTIMITATEKVGAVVTAQLMEERLEFCLVVPATYPSKPRSNQLECVLKVSTELKLPWDTIWLPRFSGTFIIFFSLTLLAQNSDRTKFLQT